VQATTAAPAAIATRTSTSAEGAAAAAKAAVSAAKETDPFPQTPGKIWKRTAPILPSASTQEPTPSRAGVRATAFTAAVAVGPSAGLALISAVRAGEAAFPGDNGRRRPQETEKVAAAAPATCYDQGCVPRADDKAAPTTAAAASSAARHTRAPHGDLQHLARGQTEIAADLSATTPRAYTVPSIWGKAALRAKREDLVKCGSGYREPDNAAGVIKHDRLCIGSSL
jgi:hypothetical protein